MRTIYGDVQLGGVQNFTFVVLTGVRHIHLGRVSNYGVHYDRYPYNCQVTSVHLHWGAEVVLCLERLPPTNVAQIRIPHLASSVFYYISY